MCRHKNSILIDVIRINLLHLMNIFRVWKQGFEAESVSKQIAKCFEKCEAAMCHSSVIKVSIMVTSAGDKGQGSKEGVISNALKSDLDFS